MRVRFFSALAAAASLAASGLAVAIPADYKTLSRLADFACDEPSNFMQLYNGLPKAHNFGPHVSSPVNLAQTGCQ